MAFDQNKIAELYPGAEDKMFEPMLIHGSTDEKLKEVCQSGEYFGQLKKDGALYQYVKTSKGSYLFGRTISKKTGLLTEKSGNVPHIMKALDIALPDNTILVGEIYYPGKNRSSKDVVSIMGCLPGKAITRQEHGTWGRIHYYIHDILMYDGVNFIIAETPNYLRYQILSKIFNKCDLNRYEYFELAQSWDDNLYMRVGAALAMGEEGMVLKKKNALYEPGKRPMTNFKAKKVDHIDAVIMGFEEPIKEYRGKELDSWIYNIDENNNRLKGTYMRLSEEGKNPIPVSKPYYFRWFNARIIIGAFDDEGKMVKIGVIHSGISDELKKKMTEKPDKYLNKVCSIQCMMLDKNELTLRHGFLLGIREDKDAKDCKLKEIFDL